VLANGVTEDTLDKLYKINEWVSHDVRYSTVVEEGKLNLFWQYSLPTYFCRNQSKYDRKLFFLLLIKYFK
jgi:hypothetical protein